MTGDPGLEVNQWRVTTNVPSTDADGVGDLCPHATAFHVQVQPGDRLVGIWTLPLAVQIGYGAGVTRNICLYCVQDKVQELMRKLQAAGPPTKA